MQTQHRKVAGWLQSTIRVDRATGPDMQRVWTLQQDSVSHVVVTLAGLQVNGGGGGGVTHRRGPSMQWCFYVYIADDITSSVVVVGGGGVYT